MRDDFHESNPELLPVDPAMRDALRRAAAGPTLRPAADLRTRAAIGDAMAARRRRRRAATIGDLALAAAVGLAAGLALAFGGSSLRPAPLPGDLDRDGRVAINDALLLSRLVAAAADPSSPALRHHDLDGDGRLGPGDVREVERAVLASPADIRRNGRGSGT